MIDRSDYKVTKINLHGIPLSVAIIAIIIAFFAISFLVFSGLLYVACACFGINFTWELSIGLFVIIILIRTFVIHMPTIWNHG